MCNGETAAGSRLLGCTNSPETRLARVLFFCFLRLDQEPISGLPLFPPLLFYQDAVCYSSYFFFSLRPPSWSNQAPPPSLRMYSTYTKLGYLPWTFSPVSPGQQKKEGSPLLALYAAELLMLSLMAVDGRRQPLALGLGARRSFNKSKSAQCHYINILGQLPWRSGGAGGLPDDAVSVQENHLRWINAAGWTQWRVPAHLDTCRPRNGGLDGRCFPNCSQAAVFCSYTHSQCRNLRPLFVQLQKMKTLGNV